MRLNPLEDEEGFIHEKQRSGKGASPKMREINNLLTQHTAGSLRYSRPAEDETDNKSDPQIPEGGQSVVGLTETGKTHLAVSIARTSIRAGRRGRFFKVVDLVNKLDAEARAERQSRTADLISRLDFLILDELGQMPFAQILFHLISKL